MNLDFTISSRNTKEEAIEIYKEFLGHSIEKTAKVYYFHHEGSIHTFYGQIEEPSQRVRDNYLGMGFSVNVVMVVK